MYKNFGSSPATVLRSRGKCVEKVDRQRSENKVVVVCNTALSTRTDTVHSGVAAPGGTPGNIVIDAQRIHQRLIYIMSFEMCTVGPFNVLITQAQIKQVALEFHD